VEVLPRSGSVGHQDSTAAAQQQQQQQQQQREQQQQQQQQQQPLALALALAPNHEAVVHVHTLRQTARLLSVAAAAADDDAVTTTITATTGAAATAGGGSSSRRCRLRFLSRAEYVSPGMTVVLRRGRTLAVGRVVATFDNGTAPQHQQQQQRRRHNI